MADEKGAIAEYCVPVDGRLQCACSKNVVAKTGTGSTTRRHFRKEFYYLQQVSDEEFGMWKVNANHVPVGDKDTVTLQRMMTEFNPEVAYYQQKIAPALRQLCRHIARGDKHRRNRQPFSAEMEYKNALAIDEQNVRATFGLGLTYLSFGEAAKGRTVFRNLVGLDGAFSPDHKHLFNEFGIQLRKNKLYKEAAEYYRRALELSDDDENLHFNLARSQFETGCWLDCLDQLCRTLNVNGGHGEGLDFCRYILKLLRRNGSPIRKDLTPALADEIAGPLEQALAGGDSVRPAPLRTLSGVVRGALEELLAREAEAMRASGGAEGDAVGDADGEPGADEGADEAESDAECGGGCDAIRD